jgi:hypothetical protein
MELAGPQPELHEAVETPDAYLPEFVKLGTQTFLYTPSSRESTLAAVSQVQPDLIIVCSWMGAQPRYIKKYTKAYQTQFPSSSILLLRQDGGDLFWRPTCQQIKNLAPALSVVRHLVDEKRPDRPNVLFHIFSNGGSYTACQFADAYRSSSPGKDQHLPISALVLDSTPSFPSSQRAHTAICESLPKSQPLRTIGSAAVWAYIGVGKLVEGIARNEDITTSLRRRLNDPNGAFMRGTLKRLYIYSQADKLIPADDVEAHAKEAIAIIGKDRVQMEDFVSSRHVGHVMLDQERYWGLIKGLWEETLKQ